MEVIGPQHVVQIITDNAANYKAAGEIIENRYQHIFWTPCVVHSINLALKEYLRATREIKPLPTLSHSDLTLQRVAESRFASHLIMARRLRRVRTVLQKMVMDDKWQVYREERNNVTDNKAREVKRCIVDDFWWDQLDYILAITDPIVGMLREDLQKVFAEFKAFSTGIEYFNQTHVIEGRMTESFISWWANHGTSAPLLQGLAFKLLEQPASSSCTERNWSTYSLIQTVKRNRLTTSRTEDLVFVHNNLRVLSRKDEECLKGPSKFWDVCGDNFDPDGHVGEFAQLSLNEPEFEVMIHEYEEDHM
ncbi:uncharacterized protein LOC141659817 [Apium graveolens]|uniref:uncharacterized protein LOC141659817 n=1 Tax=Apium graveolens TaxID=4045 RepID=UPI003D792EA2